MSTEIKEIPKELILFYTGELLGAITNFQINSIIKIEKITKVHRAPDYVKGVVNLRGDVVTVIDLKKILFEEDTPLTRENPVIMAQSEGELVGLLIDEVLDIIHVEEKNLEPPLANVMGVSREYISGVYKLEKDLAAVLDIQKILDR